MAHQTEKLVASQPHPIVSTLTDVNIALERANSGTAARKKVGPVRAGLVGAGLMGRWHAHAIRKAGASLVGVTDLDQSAAARLASNYTDSRAFSSVESLLGEGNLEVLHVCSPLDSHKRLAELAIEAGIHLIIEKPLTATAADTEALFARAAEQDLIVCPVHQFIFQDGVAKAARLLLTIGRVIDVSATVVSAGGDGLAADDQSQLIADILPHPLSLVRFLVSKTYGNARWSVVSAGRGELRVIGTSAEDITLSIFISLNARPPANMVRITGTNGTIHLNLFHGYAIAESGGATRLRKLTRPFEYSLKNLSAATFNLGRRAIRGEPAYPGLVRLVNCFYQAVRGIAAPPISMQDTIAVAQTRDLLIAKAGQLADVCD